MNPQDIINQMMQQQNRSVLTRQPTTEELDKFIDKIVAEKDETLYSTFQAIAFKLERGVHSLPEGEIYPLVLNRIKERVEGEE